MLLPPNSQLRCAGASADLGLHQLSSLAPQAWHHHPRNRSRCKSLIAGAFKCHQRGSTTRSHPLSTPATQSHSHKASSATDEIRTKAPQLSAFAAAVLLSWSSVAPPYSSASPAIQEQASSGQPAAKATASSLTDPAFKSVSSPGLLDTSPSSPEGSATGERSARRATQVVSSDALATYRLGRDSSERRHLDYHGATAQVSPSVEDLRGLSYARIANGRGRVHSELRSELPTSAEAEQLYDLDSDLFTEEALQGMQEVIRYAKYVEQQHDAELEPGCEMCTSNRLTLEKAWQVVTNEYFDPMGQFNQASWAKVLLRTLEANGGVLRTKHETYDATSGMVASLGDRWSEFLPPSAFRRALRKPEPAEREYLAGYVATGVGVVVGNHARLGGWALDAAMAESPAEEAGLRRGERILAVDQYDADTLTLDELKSILRGPAGSTVRLWLGSPTENSPARRVDLERRSLPQPPVKQARIQLEDGSEVAYVRLHYFTSKTSQSVQAALLSGEQDGVSGYIFDLRNNPGGVFEDAIMISSMLLEKGVDITETVRVTGHIDEVFQVGSLSPEVWPRPPGTLSRAPLVLLTNRSSASASEVLAGALRDNGRATIVGEQSFGKGLVQYYFPCFEDGGLKLTIAKYLTPNRYDITRDGGLQPDLSCSDYPKAGPASPSNDICIRAAMKVIKNAPEPQTGPLARARYALVDMN